MFNNIFIIFFELLSLAKYRFLQKNLEQYFCNILYFIFFNIYIICSKNFYYKVDHLKFTHLKQHLCKYAGKYSTRKR